MQWAFNRNAADTSFVQIVNPAHELWNLDRRNVEIDNQSLLPTSCEHAVKLNILARVDFLMWHVGRNVDEIPRRGLCDEFQAIAPPQAGKTADYVDHAFEIPVMMRSRLCVGVDGYSARPQFRRTSSLRGHCRAPVHAERLSGGIIQLVGPDNFHAMCSPSTGVPAHRLVSTQCAGKYRFPGRRPSGGTVRCFARHALCLERTLEVGHN